MQHWRTGEASLIHAALHWHILKQSNTPQHPNREDLLRSKCHEFSANSPSRWHVPQHSGEVSGLMRWEEEGEKAYTYIHTHTGEQGRSMSEPEQIQSGWGERWTWKVDSPWSRCPRWRWRTLRWTCPGQTEPAGRSCPLRCPPPGWSADRFTERQRQHHAGFSAAASTCRPRPCAVWAQVV